LSAAGWGGCAGARWRKPAREEAGCRGGTQSVLGRKPPCRFPPNLIFAGSAHRSDCGPFGKGRNESGLDHEIRWLESANRSGRCLLRLIQP
jgi:hypothetical protein